MKNLTLAFIFALTSASLLSQKTLEFTAGLGGTIVDIEALVEKDENPGSWATDWGTFNYGISGQFFFTRFGSVAFGAELMYQHMYWYSVRVPYITNSPIYREYSVEAMKVAPVFRFMPDGPFSVDLGPQFVFLDDISIGVLISANYYLSISDKMDIPFKMRVDIINNVVIAVPISLNAGIRFKM